MVKRVTLRDINSALAVRGRAERLVKGAGYFYFMGGQAARLRESGVYDSPVLSSRTVAEWVAELDHRLKQSGLVGFLDSTEVQTMVRFVVHKDLPSPVGRSNREPYRVVDRVTNSTVDHYASKRAADDHARELNARRCEQCGEIQPAGQSCGCFDNGSE